MIAALLFFGLIAFVFFAAAVIVCITSITNSAGKAVNALLQIRDQITACRGNLNRIAVSLLNIEENMMVEFEPDPDCECDECVAARRYEPTDMSISIGAAEDCSDTDLDDLDADDELTDSGAFFDPDERDRPKPKKPKE